MRSSKKRILTLSLFIALAFADNVFAAPSVTSITGSFTHNSNNVIINGSGFGQKTPALPYFYDNFESGTNGSSIVGQKGTVGTKTWLEYEAYGKPTYTTTQSYGQGSKSVTKRTDGDDFMTAGINGLNSTKAYLSYRYRWNASSTNWESSVMKFSRITSQGGFYSVTPSIYPQFQPKYSWAYDGYNDGEKHHGNFDFGGPSQNTWHRMEAYIELSVPAGTANGKVETRYDLVQNVDESGVLTRAASASSKVLDSFILPFDVANNPSNMYNFWADDVYFDITQARVEIGNNATFTSCSKREIQIPTSWASNGTAIGINVNQGAFAAGERAYLFVIDSKGAVSVGTPVTIGEGSSSPSGGILSSPSGFKIVLP